MIFSLSNFIVDTPFLFIIALFVFTISLILKSVKLFSLQLIFVLVMSVPDITSVVAIQIALGAVQLIIVGFTLYKILHAVEYNYQLILEKTHQTPPSITKKGYNGTRKSFL